MDSPLFFMIILFGVPLAAVAWFVYARVQADNRAKQNRVAMGAIGFDVSGGTYATGHPEIASPCSVKLSINDTEFLIVSAWDGRRLGAISRNAILALLIQKVVSLAGNRRHSGDGIPAGS
jgi:hypothetical protein